MERVLPALLLLRPGLHLCLPAGVLHSLFPRHLHLDLVHTPPPSTSLPQASPRLSGSSAEHLESTSSLTSPCHSPWFKSAGLKQYLHTWSLRFRSCPLKSNFHRAVTLTPLEVLVNQVTPRLNLLPQSPSDFSVVPVQVQWLGDIKAFVRVLVFSSWSQKSCLVQAGKTWDLFFSSSSNLGALSHAPGALLRFTQAQWVAEPLSLDHPAP